MATGKLTTFKVEKSKPGTTIGDGGGLWLRTDTNGNRHWVFRYTRAGKPRVMGLGSLDAIGLAQARRKAQEARSLLAEGKDPLAERDAQRAAQALAEARAMTFKEAAEAYVAAHRPGWKNEKHAQQWENTLATYVFPVVGAVSIADVDVTLVLQAIEPIWSTKPETASRVRGRIETVLSWAKARGYRSGENPAAWRGHLDQILPSKRKVRRVRHHPALPYAEMPAFMQALQARKGVSARALEFSILTAARSGETRAAVAKEFDLARRLWVIPAEKMKGDREHRVPLTDRAVELVREALGDDPKPDRVVFPNHKGEPLSDTALEMVLHRMGRGDVTPHGFRSTFRDWAGDRTNFANHVAEMALAHAIDDDVESAYRRGDLLDHRRRLMQAWAAYCASTPKSAGSNVTPIRATA